MCRLKQVIKSKSAAEQSMITHSPAPLHAVAALGGTKVLLCCKSGFFFFCLDVRLSYNCKTMRVFI